MFHFIVEILVCLVMCLQSLRMGFVVLADLIACNDGLANPSPLWAVHVGIVFIHSLALPQLAKTRRTTPSPNIPRLTAPNHDMPSFFGPKASPANSCL